MKLDVDFSLLDEAIKTMGAASIEIIFDDVIIDVGLGKGIEVDFEDINFDTGLASYQGRQVLLYIKDHSYGNKIQQVLIDGSKGNRFHIADCQTLEEMRKKGRFERYVVINRIDGVFSVSGQDSRSMELFEGDANLIVCQYCLENINFKKFASLPKGNNRKEFVGSFSLADFFDTYSSFFKFMPTGLAEKSSIGYTKEWPEVSKVVRQKCRYLCQECGLDLQSNRKLLHVHHINGIKSDNREHNLRALCCDCHRKQPNHSHMFVLHEDTQIIHRLRVIQGLVQSVSWDDVYKLADPGMYGVIDALQRHSTSLPEIGTQLKNNEGTLIATLDLAWPAYKVGVVVDKTDAVEAHKLGWKVYSMRYALSQINDLIARIRNKHT